MSRKSVGHDGAASLDHREPRVYTIHVGAGLGTEWTPWFDEVEIVARHDGTTELVVPVCDQAMLFGVLLRIRDLGLPLLGLRRGRPSEPSRLGS